MKSNIVISTLSLLVITVCLSTVALSSDPNIILLVGCLCTASIPALNFMRFAANRSKDSSSASLKTLMVNHFWKSDWSKLYAVQLPFVLIALFFLSLKFN